MNTPRTRHGRSVLFRASGRQEPANLALEPTAFTNRVLSVALGAAAQRRRWADEIQSNPTSRASRKNRQADAIVRAYPIPGRCRPSGSRRFRSKNRLTTCSRSGITSPRTSTRYLCKSGNKPSWKNVSRRITEHLKTPDLGKRSLNEYSIASAPVGRCLCWRFDLKQSSTPSKRHRGTRANGTDSGTEFLVELRATFARIEDGPLRFPRVFQTFRRAILHRFPFGAFFIVEAAIATVLAVTHLHRHPSVWQTRA